MKTKQSQRIRRWARVERRQAHGSQPYCERCQRAVTGVPQWKRYRNGSVHLVWMCGGHQVGGPIPQREHVKYAMEPYAQAHARLTVAHDQTWPVSEGQ